MLAYKTTRCPYCGAKIEVMKPYGINDYGNDLGEPYSYCLSCGGKYKTGKQRWSQMNVLIKSVVILKLIFNIIISSFVISGLILFVIHLLREYVFKNSFSWVEQNDIFKSLLIVAIIIFPFLTVGGIIILKQEIKEFK